MIAKVLVDVAVYKEFDYLIPDSLTIQVKLGSRSSFFGPRKPWVFATMVLIK
jgi:hypothetical protein